MRRTLARQLLIAAAGLAATAAAGQGLNPPEGASLWPAWQARLSLTASTGNGLHLQTPARAQAVQQASLLGDYYLLRHGVAMAPRWRGGLRATGGLVFGQLGPSAAPTDVPWSVSLLPGDAVADAPAETVLWPYFGIGYAGLSPRSGWGFSADLGFVARQPGTTELGPARLGSSSTLDHLELSPMLRLDVNYAF